MGGGASNSNKKSSQSQKRRPSLPDRVSDLLRRSLVSLPFPTGLIDEQTISTASQNAERIELLEPAVILTKGERAKGIYILIDGEAQVVSSSGSIIADLSKGELFGELSTLYNIPCTATVKTHAKVVMLLLKSDILKAALKGKLVSSSLMDYYVRKRYLDTSGVVNQSELMQRITKAVLKEIPLFKHWEDAVLHSLVESIQLDSPAVTLAPSDLVIAMDGDPVDEIIIVIKGRVEVLKEKELLSTLDCSRWPVWHGEEGLFTGRQCLVSVKTLSTCQLVIIKNSLIVETVKKYKVEAASDFTKRLEKWKQRAARSDPTRESHYPVEVLIKRLAETRFLSNVPLDGLYSLAVNSKTSLHQEGGSVIGEGTSQQNKSQMIKSEGTKPSNPPTVINSTLPPDTEIKASDISKVFWADDVLLLILKGAMLLNDNQEWMCHVREVLWIPKKVIPNLKLQAKQDSVILQFTGSALDEACSNNPDIKLAVPSTVR